MEYLRFEWFEEWRDWVPYCNEQREAALHTAVVTTLQTGYLSDREKAISIILRARNFCR